MKDVKDVVVIGGGVIGLSIAWEVAGQGLRVALYDQGPLGSEASWAGAGMLPPGRLEYARTPEAQLRSLSCALWPEWTNQLRTDVGIDNGYRPCGGAHVYLADQLNRLQAEAGHWRDEGVRVEECSLKELREREPDLGTDVVGGFMLPDVCQVRNPRHLKALIAACQRRGVDLIPQCPVWDMDLESTGPVRLGTAQGVCEAGQVCLCTGAWTGRLLAHLTPRLPVEPVRGQIVLLATNPLPTTRVIENGKRYLVPRPDGRVLIGSTEEYAGFRKHTTARGIAGLIEFGTRLIPALAEASVERTWAGLRPRAADELPFLGPVPGMDQVFVAAGHFRAGLQMSPGTAVLLRQMLLGQETEIPCEGFACDRQLLCSAP